MKKKSFIISIILLVLVVVLFLIFRNWGSNISEQDFSYLMLPDSPLNATYKVEESEITLNEGVFDEEGKSVRTVLEPIYGDVDGDQYIDAVLVLSETKENTTEYYLAVALKDEEGYLGLETLKLKRNEEPLSITVFDKSIQLDYRPEAKEQSHIEHEYYILMENLLLINKTPKGEDTIYKGDYVFGHESRTFSPCDSTQTYWISSESRSIAALKAIYEEKMKELDPYTPIYIVLSGQTTGAPTEGFGADFGESIVINSIISFPEVGSCSTESKDHTSPQ